MPDRGSTQRRTTSRPPDTMASASEEKLAHLSVDELMVYLSDTYRRADFEVVKRIFGARDRRNAKVEAELRAALAYLDAVSAHEIEDAEVKAELDAALTEIDAVREKCKALLDGSFRPQYEVEEMALMVGAAAPDAADWDESRVEEAKEAEVKGNDIIDLCSDGEEEERAAGGCEEEEDEEDTESLSQRAKRLRRVKPGELESGKGDVLSNSVATLGNDQQKSSSVKIEVLVAATGKMVSKPEGSKVAAFVQERPVLKTEKIDGEMPKTMLLPSRWLLGRSTIQEGSSKSNYCKAGVGDKARSSDGVPAKRVSQPSKGVAKIDKIPMVESSAKCGSGNKEVGAEKCASPPRPSEEPRITRDVVPFEPCNENNTYVQVKREMSFLPSTVTSKWISEGHIFNSLLDVNNVEVNMQAFCALYRQGKLAIEDKRKTIRANKLAEFLLDGDLHGPMKRTAEELEKQDVTSVAFLRQVTLDLSEQLFGIFRNKEDPYFC